MGQFSRCVLVVDGDAGIRRAITRELQPVFQVVQAESFDSALEAMESTRSLVAVVSGQKLGVGQTGTQLQHEVQRRAPGTIRVLMSGTMSHLDAAALLSSGVIHDFLEKPWDFGAVLRTLSHRLGLLARA